MSSLSSPPPARARPPVRSSSSSSARIRASRGLDVISRSVGGVRRVAVGDVFGRRGTLSSRPATHRAARSAHAKPAPAVSPRSARSAHRCCPPAPSSAAGASSSSLSASLRASNCSRTHAAPWGRRWRQVGRCTLNLRPAAAADSKRRQLCHRPGGPRTGCRLRPPDRRGPEDGRGRAR